jgi:hypothetical protein
MKSTLVRCAALLIVLITMSWSEASLAQWVPGGVSASALNGFADGAGNFIGAGRTKVDASGVILWSVNPLPFTNVSAAAPDRAGGAVCIGGNPGVMYVNRVSSTGAFPWGPSAINLSPSGQNSIPAVATDGAANSYVTWRDARGGQANLQLFVQKVSPAGAIQWTTNGVLVTNAGGVQQTGVLAVCGDESGGCYVAWEDYRSGGVGTSDLYVQHFSSSGTALWTANGIAVCNAAGRQTGQAMDVDGAGGAIVAWMDYRGADIDLYVQRVDGSGTSLWTPNGEPLCTAASDQGAISMTADGSGGVFAAWEDYRTSANGADVYAQHLNSSGTALWAAGGSPVSVGAGNQDQPKVALDGTGGLLVAWAADHIGNTASVAAQRLDGTGSPLWLVNGLKPMTATQNIGGGSFVGVAPDGVGGAYVGVQAILGRILPNGQSGWAPNYRVTSLSVLDVLADEGGWAQIGYNRANADGLPGYSPAITAYSLWRKRPGSTAAGPARLADPSGVLPRGAVVDGIESTPSVSGYLSGYTEFPSGTWDAVIYVPAFQFPTYSLLAPTHTDSTTQSSADEDFVVLAHSGNLLVVSSAATGHSVDNLAPGPPQNVAGGTVSPNSVVIHWSPSRESDLWHYAVYKGTSPSFVPSPANRIGQPTDASLQDDNFEPGVSHYKVSAIDRHSNESIFTLLSPSQITSVPPGSIPTRTYLGPAVPNPFHGAIALEYGITRSALVTISIYDLRGRRVARLVDGTQSPGVRRAIWDGADDHRQRVPSGVYLARFSADGVTQVQKIVMAN